MNDKKEMVKIYVPKEVKETLEKVSKQKMCSVSMLSLSILYSWLIENGKMERLQ